MYSESPVRHFRGNNFHTWDVSFNSRIWGIMCFLILLSGSCNQSSAVEVENLYGKWDIFKAMRNGVETHYLRGGYFIIDQGGRMTINITGEEEKGPFTFDNNRIAMDTEKEFIIESFHLDSMILRYPMNPESNFLFYLTKNVNEKN